VGARRGHPRSIGAFASVLVVVVLLLLTASPYARGASPSGASVLRPSASGGVTAVVTWNGQNIAAASTVGSAVHVDFSTTNHIVFNWSSAATGGGGIGTPYVIGAGRLQMFYFGFALQTQDEVVSNPVPAVNGSLTLTWPPGELQYVIAGAYAVTASLITTNGTTVFSEGFYLVMEVPYRVLSLIPLLLIGIVVNELIQIGRSGRFAAGPKRRGEDVAPSPPSTPKSPSPPAAASASTPPPPSHDSANRAAFHASGSGVILGVVAVVLAQQLGYLSLSALVPALEYMVIGGVVGAILGGAIGWGLGKLYVARHRPAAAA
jgi:hypothetical protein